MAGSFLDDFEKSDYKSSRPHPIGRPPKLSLEMIEQICDLIIEGKPLARAAMLTNISESTLYRWLALGKEIGAEEIYCELVKRVSEATECSEFELLQNMRIAGMKTENWRANAWMLERRFPGKYGKQDCPQPAEQLQHPDDGSAGLSVVV